MLAADGVRVNPWLRRLSLLWLGLKRPFLLPRVRRHTLESVDGVPILVWPDVLNPVVFRSGKYLAKIISNLEPTYGRALDMGTGSGVGAIFAARRGFRVTAVDLNPEAVRCARINILLNRLEGQVEVREGDLFEPVAGERFDLVTFNPPFFRGDPQSLFDMAWRSRDVLERFAAGLAGALTEDGQALILLSTDGDGDVLLRVLRTSGFQVEVAGRRNFGNEIMTVYSARMEKG